MVVAMLLRRGGIAKIARAAHTAGDAGERACASAVEAALLTETEHALIVRLILCGGQARIDGWQELSAAESLLRRLWCTLRMDEQDVLRTCRGN